MFWRRLEPSVDTTGDFMDPTLRPFCLAPADFLIFLAVNHSICRVPFFLCAWDCHGDVPWADIFHKTWIRDLPAVHRIHARPFILRVSVGFSVERCLRCPYQLRLTVININIAWLKKCCDMWSISIMCHDFGNEVPTSTKLVTFDTAWFCE